MTDLDMSTLVAATTKVHQAAVLGGFSAVDESPVMPPFVVVLRWTGETILGQVLKGVPDEWWNEAPADVLDAIQVPADMVPADFAGLIFTAEATMKIMTEDDEAETIHAAAQRRLSTLSDVQSCRTTISYLRGGMWVQLLQAQDDLAYVRMTSEDPDPEIDRSWREAAVPLALQRLTERMEATMGATS